MHIKKSLMLLLTICVGVIALASNGYAHAQTVASNLNNNEIGIIVAAVFAGAFGAPIVGYATQEIDKTTGTRDKFDWGQYALAVPLVLVSGLGLLLSELTSVSISATGLQADLILFIMVFMQALGIDYLKSRTGTAISNTSIQISAAAPAKVLEIPPQTQVKASPDASASSSTSSSAQTPGQNKSVSIADNAVTQDQ